MIPVGDLAVNGAKRKCCTHGRQRWGIRHHRAWQGYQQRSCGTVGTGAAGFGAGGPGILGVSAVDDARVGVEVLLNANRVASFTAVSDISDHRTSAGLDTATAAKDLCRYL